MMIPMETIQDKLLKPPNSPNAVFFFFYFTYEDNIYNNGLFQWKM